MSWRALLICVLASGVLVHCGTAGTSEEVVATEGGSGPVSPTDDGWDQLLPNPRRPAPGVLSGGQPSAEQLAAARDLGFRTVVNLRSEGEPGSRAADVEALGMTYVELPIRGAEGLTEDNARAFAEILAAAERPAMVHCGSGNRVGGLFALKAYYVDGLAAEEALVLGRESGLTRLAGAVRSHLELADGDR